MAERVASQADHEEVRGPDPGGSASTLGADLTGGEVDVDFCCPSCSAILCETDLFAVFRVCPGCQRHFWLPARERLALLVDPDSFAETSAQLISVDPLVFHDPLPLPDRLAEAQERGGVFDAIITGIGAIGGQSAVFVMLDLAFLGSSIGIVAGEKITLAMELAAARRLPLVAVCSGGASRTQEGMLSLVQLAKTASAAARLHRAGVPFISVLTHPTTGGVYAGLANQADIILAEPGAQIGFSAAREPTMAAVTGSGINSAEFLLAHGMIDSIVDRPHLRDFLGTLLDLFANRGAPRPGAPLPPAGTTNLRAFEEMALARHPERPTATDYLRRLLPTFVELHGDRVCGDDPAVICGFGRLEGVTIAVIAQERGRGEAHGHRRGGRMMPAGYRKAVRLMRLAGHLELPLLTLIDTPGAMSGAEAEADGIGMALAQTLGLISILPVPIVSVVIGEGGSAGALALAVGDRMLMQEHAIYSVVGPESALYREADRAVEAAASLKLTARDCLRLGVIDGVVPEPNPAAHADPDRAAHLVRTAIVQALADVTSPGRRRLLEDRARKVRYLGQATPEGREAARVELRELQELQRTISRSLGDLRVRLESRQLTLPNLPQRPNWPTLPNLPPRPHLPNLPNLRRINVQRPDLADLAGRLAATVRGQGTGDRTSPPDASPDAPGRSEPES